ncbi:hypothetical protein C8J56DRAFT_947504 [Mycena floridula]|nr:hypothetical protein C8J56DRAFT_947504 [Mycena floridula]
MSGQPHGRPARARLLPRIPVLSHSVRFLDFPLDLQIAMLQECCPRSLIQLNSLCKTTRQLLERPSIWKRIRIRMGLPDPLKDPGLSCSNWYSVWTEQRLVQFIFGIQCHWNSDLPFVFCFLFEKRVCDECYPKWILSPQFFLQTNGMNLTAYDNTVSPPLLMSRLGYCKWIISISVDGGSLIRVKDLERADYEYKVARQDDYVATTGDFRLKRLDWFTIIQERPGSRLEHLAGKIVKRGVYTKELVKMDHAITLWHERFRQLVTQMAEDNCTRFNDLALKYNLGLPKHVLNIPAVNIYVQAYTVSLESITLTYMSSPTSFFALGPHIRRGVGKLKAVEDSRLPTHVVCTSCTQNDDPYLPIALLRHTKDKHPHYFPVDKQWPCIICVTPKLFSHSGLKHHLSLKHDLDSAWEKSGDPYDFEE